MNRLMAFVERHPHAALAVLLAMEVILLVVAADGRPLWHDEITTFLTASLPITVMRDAYLGGMDLSFPLNTVATHVVHLTIGLGEVSGRLPAMVGYLGASAFVFETTRRRSNSVIGLSAVMLLTGTLAWRYGTEARGYGLSLLWAAAAGYAWAEAAANRTVRVSSMLMGLALAAGLWTHQYFVLAFVPIAAGELTRQIVRRQFVIRPFVIMGLALGTLVPLVPLIEVGAEQRRTFWSRPDAWTFLDVYRGLLTPDDRGVYFALLCGAIVIWLLMCRRHGTAERARIAPHESAAAIGSLLLPAIGVLLGFWSGAFATRYLTFSTVALVTVVTVGVWRAGASFRRTDGAILVLGSLVLVATAWSTITGTTRWRPADSHPLLVARLQGSQETAVVGSAAYLQFWHYASPDQRAHAIYLADPAAELATRSGNTIDLGYLAVSRFSSLRVERLDRFVTSHRQFVLYSIGRTWQEDALRAHGAVLTPVASDQGGTLYDVRLPARGVNPQ